MRKSDLKAILEQDEISYESIFAEDPEVLAPLVRELAKSEDEKIASGAAYISAAIAKGAEGLASELVSDRRESVRVAVAGGLALNSSAITPTISTLLEDDDVGVIRFAMRASARILGDPFIRARIVRISNDQSLPQALRTEADKLLSNAP